MKKLATHFVLDKRDYERELAMKLSERDPTIQNLTTDLLKAVDKQGKLELEKVSHNFLSFVCRCTNKRKTTQKSEKKIG